MKNRRGFTLIEVVMAIAILAIVGVPLMQFFTGAFKFQTRGQEKTEINKVLQYVAENLKNGRDFNADFTQNINEGDSFSLGKITSGEISSLTQNYDVSIKIKSIVNDQADIGKNTPNSFQESIVVLSDSSVEITENDVTITKKEGEENCFIFNVTNPDPTGYDVLIKNESAEVHTFKIQNLIESSAPLRLYKSNDEGCPEISLTWAPGTSAGIENRYTVFNLGTNNSVESTNENIYIAEITATNAGGEIETSMEVSFARAATQE